MVGPISFSIYENTIQIPIGERKFSVGKMKEIFAKVIIGDSRKMIEIKDKSVDLVVTSPPYWHIKDYGVKNQVGYGQTLHSYLKDLFRVWKECFRILKPGTRLCVNIGDQFLRSIIFGRYKIAPLHSEVITQCEKLGFDYMGSIIWQKKTTMHTTGGANVMGSYPYPGNGMVEIDYEFILIFKKPGKKTVPPEIKELSKLSKEEWKEYFSGHWRFPGERQICHEAMFPEELPKRLIKMYTFVGDTVLDPFLGSGTTIKAAINLNRNAIGYEINEDFLDIIKEKVGTDIEIIKRTKDIELDTIDYVPTIQDAKPLIEPKLFKFEDERLYRVAEIVNEETLKLDTGLVVKLFGVKILPTKEKDAKEYLEKFVKGKHVFLKFDTFSKIEEGTTFAYVYLKNKIFVNKEMIKLGFAKSADYYFSYKDKFLEIENSKLHKNSTLKNNLPLTEF